VGAEDAPVDLTVYYDYMCPACGAFEAANGAELDRLLEEGTVQVELRPISFLDETSQGTRYSTRAANAFATVADQAPDQAWAFHQALYADQPEEGTTGLSDAQIADVAREAGVPDDVVEQLTEMRHEGWVAEVTEQAFDSGVTGTPTVLLDGEPFEGDLYQPGPLTEAVEAAADQQ
jgi:protein-disulfide isomerase